MFRLWRFRFATAATVCLTFAGCSDDNPSSDENGSNQSLSNPVVLEAFMRAEGPAVTEGMIDGLDRIVTALDGGAADGVTVTPISGGNSVVVALDLDGDTSRESSLTATITGDLASGAGFQINQIVDPSIPSLSASVGATVTKTGPTGLAFTNFAGTVSQDEPGSMNASDVVYTGGTVDLERSTETPDGSIECDISGEEQTLNLTSTFQPNGAGGWEVQITGSGVDFTVP